MHKTFDRKSIFLVEKLNFKTLPVENKYPLRTRTSTSCPLLIETYLLDINGRVIFRTAGADIDEIKKEISKPGFR